MKTLLFLLLLPSIAAPLFATSARLRSMGNLQFSVEDNVNRISQFNLGKNPSGLFSDEDSNSVDLDLVYATESSCIDTIESDTVYTSIGNAVPHDLLEYIPTYNRNEFSYVPFMNFPTNHLFYVKRNKSEKRDIWGNLQAKDAYGFGLTYGKLNQKFTGGNEHAGSPSVELVYSRLLHQAIHFGLGGGYLYANYEGDEDFEKAALSAFTITPGFAFVPDPALSIGGKIDYHMLNCSFGSSPNEIKYSGNALNVSGTAIVVLDSITAGATIAYKLANARTENENFSLSGLDFTFKPRIPVRIIPFSIGGLVNYEFRRMCNESDDADTLYNNEFAELQLGAGPALDTRYFLVGFEYVFSKREEAEIFIGRDSTKANSNTYRIGAEFKPLSTVSLRGGYEHTATEEEEPPSRSITNTLIGGGFGVVVQRYALDFCYNYITTDEEANQRTTTDNVFMISMRYLN